MWKHVRYDSRTVPWLDIFPTDTSPIDTSPTGQFPTDTSPTWHFPDQTFPPAVISPTGHYPTGHFPDQTLLWADIYPTTPFRFQTFLNWIKLINSKLSIMITIITMIIIIMIIINSYFLNDLMIWVMLNLMMFCSLIITRSVKIVMCLFKQGKMNIDY